MIQEPKPVKTKEGRRIFISLSRKQRRPESTNDIKDRRSTVAGEVAGLPPQQPRRELPSSVLLTQNITELRLTGVEGENEEEDGGGGERKKGIVRKPLLISTKSEQPKPSESVLGEDKRGLLASRSLPVPAAGKEERKSSFTRNASLSTEEARKRLKSWKKTTIYRKKSQLH